MKNEQKRLVLIGIRRKGEKGFKTRFDTRVDSKDTSSEKVRKNSAINPGHISDSSQIIRIMPS
ncbi:hypothetical protein KJ966_16320 [bacterium]|nr:hypothetical protein [bacterium]